MKWSRGQEKNWDTFAFSHSRHLFYWGEPYDYGVNGEGHIYDRAHNVPFHRAGCNHSKPLPLPVLPSTPKEAHPSHQDWLLAEKPTYLWESGNAAGTVVLKTGMLIWSPSLKWKDSFAEPWKNFQDFHLLQLFTWRRIPTWSHWQLPTSLQQTKGGGTACIQGLHFWIAALRFPASHGDTSCLDTLKCSDIKDKLICLSSKDHVWWDGGREFVPYFLVKGDRVVSEGHKVPWIIRGQWS